jgi:hypothetical protein
MTTSHSTCDCHACRPEAVYDPVDRDCIDTVLEHGWQVVLVGSGACACCGDDEVAPSHDDGPAFAYTVGLGHRAGHPELVMSGLDPALMHRSLNRLAERIVDGRRLAPGDVLEGVLGAAPVAVAAASPYALEEVVTWSGWFHRRRPDALVLVWPTTSGIFAWQPGAPEVLDELQPTGWREAVPLSGALAHDPPWDFPVPPDAEALTCTHVLEKGHPLLWVARQGDPARGEDWSLHCGAAGHADDEVVVVHLAHLVRAAPGVRAVADLPLGWEAGRSDVDSEWRTSPIGG